MISGFGSGFRGEFGLVGSRFGGWFGGRESVVNIYLKIASTRRVAGTRLKVMGCVIVCVCKGKDVFDEDRKIEKTLFKNLSALWCCVIFIGTIVVTVSMRYSAAAGVTTATGVPFLCSRV